MDLAYNTQGSGPTVVLVHGHPFDRSMWRAQAPLADAFRIVAPDLRGYGASPTTPGTVEMATLAADVWALVDSIGAERVAVVGLSMGGLVAMEMRLARPHAVGALGLVATTAERVTEPEAARRRAGATALEEHGMAVEVERMLPSLLGDGVDDATTAEVRAMMEGNDPRGSAAALRGRARRPDYRPGLRAMETPAFVCVGDRDPWSTAAVTAELVGCLRDPEVLRLAGVGHLPNLERPGKFNAALGAFLRAAAPATP